MVGEEMLKNARVARTVITFGIKPVVFIVSSSLIWPQVSAIKRNGLSRYK
jgi:hypothetical protein